MDQRGGETTTRRPPLCYYYSADPEALAAEIEWCRRYYDAEDDEKNHQDRRPPNDPKFPLRRRRADVAVGCHALATTQRGSRVFSSPSGNLQNSCSLPGWQHFKALQHTLHPVRCHHPTGTTFFYSNLEEARSPPSTRMMTTTTIKTTKRPRLLQSTR